MKKIKSKILIIILSTICLLGIFTGSSAGFDVKFTAGDGGTKGIGNDYDLADWAENHPKQFLSVDWENYINKTMGLHSGGTATIAKESASCMYHAQGGSAGGTYKIESVIKIQGQQAYIYNSKDGEPKKVQNKYIGAIAYSTYQSLNSGEKSHQNGHYNNNDWKQAFKDIFFKSSTGLKGKVSSDFKTTRPNKENAGKVSDAIAKGKKESTVTKPKKIATKDKYNKNTGYIGPLKMKKGGYTPKSLSLTINGETKDNKKAYYKNSDGEYVAYDKVSDIKNNKSFYVYAGKDEDKNVEWEVKLDFDWKGHSAVILLIAEHAAGGQNLGIFSSDIDYDFNIDGDEEVLIWNGRDDDTPPDDADLMVYKVDEDTRDPIEGVEFRLYEMFPVTNDKGETVDESGNVTNDPFKYAWQYVYNSSSEKIAKTDRNGIASFTKLTPGWKYYLVEQSTVNPYDMTIQQNIGNANWQFIQAQKDTSVKVTYENRAFGTINIHKVESTEIDDDDTKYSSAPPFEGVKFKIYYYDDNDVKHYLADDFSSPRKKSNDNFTTDANAAHEFITDASGNITVGNVPCYRTYYAVETGFVNPELADFYEIKDDELEFDLTEPDSSATDTYRTQTLGNPQVYTKISGKVWEDGHQGKGSLRNDVYDGDTTDENGKENLVSGIQVKLVYRSNPSIIVVNEDGNPCITTTDGNGYYEFKKILKENLDNYTVVFEYNGLKYKDVLAHTELDNGSKAIEIDGLRDQLNNNYSTIEKGVSKNGDGTVTNNLAYDFAEHKSTLVQNLSYNTDAGKYVTHVTNGINNTAIGIDADTKAINLADYLKVPEGKTYEEVININLGIYEREQPDIAILKDVENIRVEINNKEHTYNYSQRFVNQGVYEQGYNDIGVKFGIPYGDMKYTREIYKSDYTWVNPADVNKELEVYVTYRIQLRNESTSLQTTINQIVDYYDIRYTLTEDNGTEDTAGIGTELNEKGNIKYGTRFTGEKKDLPYNETYKKLSIDLNETLDHQNTKDIYVQFKLPRDKVENIIEEDSQKFTENIVELTSYSTKDKDGKVYAGIDKDSQPENTEPGNKDTYEDDTDKAPPITWTQTPGDDKGRKINGTVFLDSTTGTLQSGQIREGDGKYDKMMDASKENEKPISGVKVKMIEKSGTGLEYYTGEGKYKQGDSYYNNYEDTTSFEESSSVTDANGYFEISGYIPGDYIVMYTWGNNIYVDLDGDGTAEKQITVQDYKGTKYDYDRYNNNKNDSHWYTIDPTERYSDAIDDIGMRNEIDAEMKELQYYEGTEDTRYTKQEMKSSTLKMSAEVEYPGKANEYSDGSTTYGYSIDNTDFGIVERARQRIELKKRISHLRITLANGEVISDVDVDEDGKTLTGEKKHVTAMPQNSNGTILNKGFVKAELDNELLQGSTLEVTYRFKFYNRSEVDIIDTVSNKIYDDTNVGVETADTGALYYRFGSTGDNAIYNNGKLTGETQRKPATQIVTITPNMIVDYLDKDWGYEESKNKDYGWTAITKENYKENLKDNEGKYIPKNIAIFGADSEINNKIIIYTEYLKQKNILPASEEIVDLNVSKKLTTTDEIELDNDTEVLKLTKPGGGKIPPKPGNYIPGKTPGEPDESVAQTVIITPSTGANLEYVVPVTIGVIALITLGVGVVIIKKKVL